MNSDLSRNETLLPIHFRYFKKNTYSYSALIPVLPNIDFVKEPVSGIMLYSFFTNQKEDVFREVMQAQASGISAFFIAGGPHPSGAPVETLDFFDAVVIGEGEVTLPALISQIRSNFQNGVDLRSGFENISGIAFKNASGEIVSTPKRDAVQMDCYPCFSPDNIWRPLELSRGCPHRCKFCQTPQIFGHQMRHRSVSEIVKYAAYYDDLRFISSNAFAYGSNGVTAKSEKVKELLSSLSELENKRIFFGTFPSEVRPEFVTDEMIDLVKTYCANDSLSIGAQSGSDIVLKEIGRGHLAEDVYNAAEICFANGITPIVDFIIGFPSETESDQQQSLEMIDWLCQRGGEVRAHYLSPLPSTAYENIVPSEVHPEISKQLGKLALGGKLKGTWENIPKIE
ncbi:TIGR04013 family B12-binding domain/radical SAM domain-containing protein [Methanimicrococcus blatticola]|uniref:B12-binding domain/radical SAM domain protein n=1 Tax=Methanimicrococcus blatticola TaxID=91560 RepID=A0A484F3Q5_9EURY|nr:TIGR04013 family B12-binding domain/radical SAM domain-containing protein [Methanimicrococcus blatticola]MBZ3935736.1 TIGR04013 family B12-binding domain/radical SAM domain-containing protein [Methanimicrococcus blatticola]MCC2508144.1 TIGR04013 family B12-binding domain/radical SAM domain-containing protein [Methanimicrococcus blatticola]TDQ68778.1 B12-binding domain/radical SAM domain protein [Methanimicrococcus blatticola]